MTRPKVRYVIDATQMRARMAGGHNGVNGFNYRFDERDEVKLAANSGGWDDWGCMSERTHDMCSLNPSSGAPPKRHITCSHSFRSKHQAQTASQLIAINHNTGTIYNSEHKQQYLLCTYIYICKLVFMICTLRAHTTDDVSML
jgi:hypothetical protein